MIFIILYREKNIQNKCLHYMHADLTLKSFLFFNLLYMMCMDYALLQRVVTHDYIGSASAVGMPVGQARQVIYQLLHPQAAFYIVMF